MALIRLVLYMMVIVVCQLKPADSQFSVLARGQVEIIKLLEEITTTSTQLVPNITAMLTHHGMLLQNSSNVLNEMNMAVRQIAAAQTQMAASLNMISTLLQNVYTVPRDCSYISDIQNHGSGVYTINPRDGLQVGSFEVYCNMETDEGGWTVIQKRFDGSVDFYLGWNDYENGFGSLHGEHWLGLQKIHRLTSSGRWTLRIDLEDFNGTTGYAQYGDFKIGNAESYYRHTYGTFTGNIRNSFGHGLPFTTKDKDNDAWIDGNCAIQGQGSWWYYQCHKSNLNGIYQGTEIELNAGQDSLMCWYAFSEGYQCDVLKKSEMKLRRTQ